MERPVGSLLSDVGWLQVLAIVNLLIGLATNDAVLYVVALAMSGAVIVIGRRGR